jgi:hypothetical protein
LSARVTQIKLRVIGIYLMLQYQSIVLHFLHQ